MSKYRSRVDYLAIANGAKGGYNLGLDNSLFLRRESVERVFERPRVGTQGKSTGGTGADTDISGGTDNAFKISVHGGPVVDVVLTLTGLTTGSAIAAALETKINDALIAAGLDTRVWVEFNAGGPDQYIVYDQYTGLASAVVITDATSNNVADDLKLGVANGGTEVVGTDDQDFMLITTGGPKFSQPNESNQHRSGRFHSGIVLKKEEASFEMDTYINMSGSAGASLDEAIMLVLESAFGKKTVVASNYIRYEQGLPNFTFSLGRASTIIGEYYTGAYVKSVAFAFPGAGPATAKYSGMASTASKSGLQKIAAGVSASTTVTVTPGQEAKYELGSRVMVVDTDGRTILYGHDGQLSVAVEPVLDSGNVILSSAITCPINSLLVPWHPGAIQETGRDNIFTDLVGSFKLRQGGSEVDVTNIEFNFDNDHVDLNNRFGKKNNQGFVAGNRATGTLSVTFDLSNETYHEIVRLRKFGGLNPEVTLGDPTNGRYMRLRFSKWIPSLEAIDVPENGTTPYTMTGVVFQSASGMKDPFTVDFG